MLIQFRVIDGADSTLDSMEKVPVNEKNRPKSEIKINSVSDSGSKAGIKS